MSFPFIDSLRTVFELRLRYSDITGQSRRANVSVHWLKQLDALFQDWCLAPPLHSSLLSPHLRALLAEQFVAQPQLSAGEPTPAQPPTQPSLRCLSDCTDWTPITVSDLSLSQQSRWVSAIGIWVNIKHLMALFNSDFGDEFIFHFYIKLF